MDLISVVVPIYNTVPKFLDECLSCIQKQTYSNIEVLCVDGGSNQETMNVILEYCDKDNRFSLINTEKGVSNQRNIGIEKSKGDYILFIDSDDYFANDFIYLLYDGIKQSNADISIPRIQRTVFKGEEIVEKELYDVIQIPEDVTINNYFEYSRSGELVNPIKLYRKSLIGDHRFHTNMTYGEDLVFNYELSKKTYKTWYVGSALYYYRVIGGNNSQERRLDQKGLRIISYLHWTYKKANKSFRRNIDGVYNEFCFVFNSFYYALAKNKNIKYLLWMNKYKPLFLKRYHSVHDIAYLLAPILMICRRTRKTKKL